MKVEEQFLFFCTNIGNEKLLKEEIHTFYPDFNLSYSRKGFLTYKNKGIQYDLNTISQLELTFSTRCGICFGRSNPIDLLTDLVNSCDDFQLTLDKCTIHSFSINTDFELSTSSIFQGEVNQYTPINKTVIDVIALSDKEIWCGVHKVAKTTTHYPNSQIDLELPINSPSKSYLKIAQAIELLHIEIKRNDRWLDFGSAPGGASYYLLNRGVKVWGIDPAKMDRLILANSNYTHISKPVQDLAQEDLPLGDIDWIYVDLNLNPNQAIKEILRLSKKYNNRLKGILFTVQIVKDEYVQSIEDFEEEFFNWGFSSVISRQVPAHKREYLILAKK